MKDATKNDEISGSTAPKFGPNGAMSETGIPPEFHGKEVNNLKSSCDFSMVNAKIPKVSAFFGSSSTVPSPSLPKVAPVLFLFLRAMPADAAEGAPRQTSRPRGPGGPGEGYHWCSSNHTQDEMGEISRVWMRSTEINETSRWNSCASGESCVVKTHKAA